MQPDIYFRTRRQFLFLGAGLLATVLLPACVDVVSARVSITNLPRDPRNLDRAAAILRELSLEERKVGPLPPRPNERVFGAPPSSSQPYNVGLTIEELSNEIDKMEFLLVVAGTKQFNPDTMTFYRQLVSRLRDTFENVAFDMESSSGQHLF